MAAQITALVIFVAMFVLAVTDKIERHYVTLGCALLTLLLVFGLFMHSPSAMISSLNLQSIFETDFRYHTGASSLSVGINRETIFFIFGMMVMVEGMADSGFFRWLCMTAAKAVHYKAIPIFFTFMLMSAVL